MLRNELLVGYGRTGLNPTQTFAGPVPVAAVREMFAWEVQEVPTFVNIGGVDYDVPGRKALVRVGDNGVQVLGTPSAKYAPHQYTGSLVGGVERILGGGLAINAAGMTNYGAKAWVSVSLQDTVCTPSGVEFLPFLAAMGSHDSTIATQYKRTALNMICNNMIGKLHRDNGAGVVKIRHTANSMLRLETAQQALQVLAETTDEFSAQIESLCEQELTARQWDALVEQLAPLAADSPEGRGRTVAEGKREALHGLYKSDPRCAPWAGTLWGAVQTHNTYERWVATVRGADRQERNMERDLTEHWDSIDQTVVDAFARLVND